MNSTRSSACTKQENKWKHLKMFQVKMFQNISWRQVVLFSAKKLKLIRIQLMNTTRSIDQRNLWKCTNKWCKQEEASRTIQSENHSTVKGISWVKEVKVWWQIVHFLISKERWQNQKVQTNFFDLTFFNVLQLMPLFHYFYDQYF